MKMKFLRFLLEWEDTKKFINLKSVIKATTEDIIEFLDKNATKKGKKSWLFVPKGSDNKICLVAHIDRIFDDCQPKKIIKKKHGEKREWTSPQGICGDDRCGVYALLHLWRNLPDTHKPFLLFTHEEESGMFGAKEAVKVFADELPEVSYFIELDRRGHKEMVFYNYDAPEFKKHIGKHDFEEKPGSASDISILGKKFKKSSVNVSVGYYGQHKKDEYIIIKHLMDSISKVKNICLTNEPLSKEAATLPKQPKRKKWTNYNWDEYMTGTMYDKYENDFYHREPIKQTFKFRLGEKVILTNHSYKKDLIGKVGTIRRITKISSIPYDVEFDNGQLTYADEDQLISARGEKAKEEVKNVSDTPEWEEKAKAFAKKKSEEMEKRRQQHQGD
jgi:hypothetical protein